MKNNLLIHVPHSSLFIPDEYRHTALISQEELEEENLFLCDTGIIELIPEALRENAVIFPYSRLYCDVERFRDSTEPMESYGMGSIYTKDSHGREIFRPDPAHKEEISNIYDKHHEILNTRVKEILARYGSCVIIDLHSYSDAAVERLFGYKNCPDVCIGTEIDYYDYTLVKSIEQICKSLGLTTEVNYPYKGSLVPNVYYGHKDTGIVSIMLEINKRVLEKQ